MASGRPCHANRAAASQKSDSANLSRENVKLRVVSILLELALDSGRHWQVNGHWRGWGSRARLTERHHPLLYYRHRFPGEIINHAVWLYHVFSLSLRDVELILAERGVVVSYETVRGCCKKLAASFADRLQRRRPRPGDKWHMGEVFIRIQGVQH